VLQQQLDALGGALSDLGRVDPIELGSRETVQQLEEILARTEALVTRAVGAFDSSREWCADEARSTAAWLTATCKIPSSVAARQVRLGGAAPNLPVFEDLWLKGQVTGAHVDLLGRIRRFETEDLLAHDEGELADLATSVTFNQFARCVRYWEDAMAPSVTAANTELQHTLREVHHFEDFNGMFYGKWALDAISGAIFDNELRRIDGEFFDQDWAEMTERRADDPDARLRRTAAQRKADALVEMATRSASVPPGARRPEPLFTVLVNYELLHGRICELAQGIAITPGSLVPWLDQAHIERAVFGPGTRVEVSERARLFTGATRRAIEVRDRECSHPLCEERVGRCQADHIKPYSEGGLTVQENGRLLCGFHNRLAYSERKSRPPPDG
jgi:hypothetical protein